MTDTTHIAQRWRERRDSYRRRGEAWAAYERGCDVAPVGRPEAHAFIALHHYAGTVSTSRRRHGLFHRGELVGVALYAHPIRDEVLTAVFPGDARESLELSRFVLLDEVPFDGETWFLRRSRRLLRAEGFRGVVSFSDPLPRARADGTVVKPGHVGIIYQASSALYLGQARADTLLLLPDGTAFHRRGLAKLRGGESRWEVAARALVRHGAPAPACLGRGAWDGDELRPWLAAWLPRLTRRVRHPGNHKYAFALSRADQERLDRQRRPLRRFPKAVA